MNSKKRGFARGVGGGGGVESGNGREAPVCNGLTPDLDLDRHPGPGGNHSLYF